LFVVECGEGAWTPRATPPKGNNPRPDSAVSGRYEYRRACVRGMLARFRRVAPNASSSSGRTRIRSLRKARRPRQARSSDSWGWLAGVFVSSGPLGGRFVTDMLAGRGCPDSTGGSGMPAHSGWVSLPQGSSRSRGLRRSRHWQGTCPTPRNDTAPTPPRSHTKIKLAAKICASRFCRRQDWT